MITTEIQTVTAASLILFSLIIFISFLIIEKRYKQSQRKITIFYQKERELENKIGVKQVFEEKKEYQESKRVKNKKIIDKLNTGFEQEFTGINAGGYIILDLPDNLRSMFHDLLKGFEDFAKLKGYNIIFSIDNSLQKKIAFKFTLQDDSVNVSTQTVRQDIKEYIEKLNSGNSFDDLPVIISPAEHSLVSTTLKNRLNFLQHNYALEKNTREYYEKFFKIIASSNYEISKPTSIYIQTGGNNIPKNIVASNSSNIIFGNNNLYENNSDHSIIKITNSFNKKKEQIYKLEEIIKLLKEEKNIQTQIKRKLITNFDKIKVEIADEEQPNKSKIFKWFSNIKKVLENVVLSKESTEAIQWICDNLNFVIHKISTGT